MPLLPPFARPLGTASPDAVSANAPAPPMLSRSMSLRVSRTFSKRSMQFPRTGRAAPPGPAALRGRIGGRSVGVRHRGVQARCGWSVCHECASAPFQMGASPLCGGVRLTDNRWSSRSVATTESLPAGAVRGKGRSACFRCAEAQRAVIATTAGGRLSRASGAAGSARTADRRAARSGRRACGRSAGGRAVRSARG